MVKYNFLALWLTKITSAPTYIKSENGALFLGQYAVHKTLTWWKMPRFEITISNVIQKCCFLFYDHSLFFTCEKINGNVLFFKNPSISIERLKTRPHKCEARIRCPQKLLKSGYFFFCEALFVNTRRNLMKKLYIYIYISLSSSGRPIYLWRSYT
jgi:hypothetical protein